MGEMLGLTIPFWQMSNTTCVSYTRHPHLNLTRDVAHGFIASWRVPEDHGYFWICQEAGFPPCLSDPLILQHNDTCLLALISPHRLYHTQELFLTRRHKREPLTALVITILMG